MSPRNTVAFQVTEVYTIEVDETERLITDDGKKRDVPLNIQPDQIKDAIERHKSILIQSGSRQAVNIANPTVENKHAYKTLEYGVTKSVSVTVEKV